MRKIQAMLFACTREVRQATFFMRTWEVRQAMLFTHAGTSYAYARLDFVHCNKLRSLIPC